MEPIKMYACFNPRRVGLDLPAGETLDLAAAAGFAGVDLLVRDLVDSGASPRALRGRLGGQGLRGGGWARERVPRMRAAWSAMARLVSKPSARAACTASIAAC